MLSWHGQILNYVRLTWEPRAQVHMVLSQTDGQQLVGCADAFQLIFDKSQLRHGNAHKHSPAEHRLLRCNNRKAD